MLRTTSATTSLLMLGALLLGACAAPVAPYRTPDHWSKDGYEWPPGSGRDDSPKKSPQLIPTAPARAKRVQAEHKSSSSPAPTSAIVGQPVPRVETPDPTFAPMQENRECLRELRKLGVKYETLSELKGVENPIEVIGGRLGGIIFWASDRRPLELDCRLALALHQLGPTFKKFGVTRVRFSGAYSYRRTRSGRLSHHAHGLAIDLHDIAFGGKTLSIEEDFARGAGCQGKNPTINRLACAIRQRRFFEEFLDPDFNFDHRDHLHLAVPKRHRT